MHSHNKGFSLLSTLVSLVLLGLLALVGTRLSKNVFRSQNRMVESSEASSNLSAALIHLLKVGRLSEACSNPSLSELQCDINYDPSAGVPPKTVRFVVRNSSLVYEEKVDATTWATRTSYPGIQSLDVCSKTEILGTTCAIKAKAPGQLAAQFSPTADRYFLIKLKATPSKGTEAFAPELQSAFYVRHPFSVAGLRYQWGGVRR